MKTHATIVLGNAASPSNIIFRKKCFLTESNRKQIEECVRAFIDLSIPIAFKNLVKMTCCPKNEIPKEFWENIQLDPNLICDQTWNSFVSELRYQYKITHPYFMEEFIVPDECVGAYDILVSHTSEVAAYMFYKKVSNFLYDHISSPIGQDHISDTFNRLTWHSRDANANRFHQIKGLRRLSLRDYEAAYFYDHLDECIALFQNMWNYMLMDEQPSVTEPAKFPMTDDDLPFFFGNQATEEKSFLELSKENILEYETDFFKFVFSNDDDSLNRLQTAGFDINLLRFKAVAIYRVLRAHRDMLEAVEALSK